MDSVFFEEWIRELDSKFEREGRKIVFIVDNCLVYLYVKDFKVINLVFLSFSIIFKIQFMDQGVIRVFKVYYRLKVV